MAAGESARARAAQLREEAARLTAEAERWTRGADGEQRVGAILDSADRATTRVLHDRLLRPGVSDTNLDHLVVSPAGVHLIDTKNWVGRLSVHERSLWQHWTNAEGPRHENRIRELAQLRGLAADVHRLIGRPVTPVLCLAAASAATFTTDQPVQGVYVLPADGLLAWLAAQPVTLPAEQVASLAVELSVTFPPAVGGSLSRELLAPDVPGTGRPGGRRGSGPARARPGRPASARARRSEPGTIRAVLGLVVVVALLAGGTQLVRSLGRHAAPLVAPAAAPAAAGSSPVAVLTPARRQALEDWTVRAGLYRDRIRPAGLAEYNLASYAAACRDQQDELAPLRRGLLAAPDPLLAAAAKRYDAAAQAFLDACARDRPAALHRADGALTAAAGDVNVRYNRLLGRDPASLGAERVL